MVRKEFHYQDVLQPVVDSGCLVNCFILLVARKKDNLWGKFRSPALQFGALFSISGPCSPLRHASHDSLPSSGMEGLAVLNSPPTYLSHPRGPSNHYPEIPLTYTECTHSRRYSSVSIVTATVRTSSQQGLDSRKGEISF
jgi:hypothetical protein